MLAVKKMRGDASKEVNLLKRINHFNLIKLQGYCENDACSYLVSEYMENGSLREWLSENKTSEHQILAKRILIALEWSSVSSQLHGTFLCAQGHKQWKHSSKQRSKSQDSKFRFC